jgi:hypothetical protein
MGLPGASKLNEVKVMEIKDLFKTTTLKDQQIADMFGVSRVHIGKIRRGQRWNTSTRSYVSKVELQLQNPTKIVPLLITREKLEKNFYDYLCDGISYTWKWLYRSYQRISHQR